MLFFRIRLFPLGVILLLWEPRCDIWWNMAMAQAPGSMLLHPATDARWTKQPSMMGILMPLLKIAHQDLEQDPWASTSPPPPRPYILAQRFFKKVRVSLRFRPRDLSRILFTLGVPLLSYPSCCTLTSSGGDAISKGQLSTCRRWCWQRGMR